MLSFIPTFLLETETFLLFMAGAVIGGFINGLAGFGTALLTLGFWLAIMPPLQAVSIIVVSSAITGLQGLWLVRAEVARKPKRVMRFLVAGIIGIPFGISALQSVNVEALKMIIAIFMLSYGLFFMARASLPTLRGSYRLADVLIGLAGGVFGGLAGLSGALPTFWLSLKDWSKGEIRAILQPYNVVILALTAVLLWGKGAFDRQTIVLLILSLPISIVSAQLGIVVFKRLKDTHFRRGLIILMFISGAGLLTSILPIF